MINYYQPFLLPFLTHKHYRLPGHVRRTYFLSFEDGLWVLLKKKRIPKGSNILIPDFFCTDVINNIRLHGYIPVFYPVDEQLAISKEKLDTYIGQYTPRVIIIFHACGITRIFPAHIFNICTTYSGVLVIEDAVHTLIDPETISISHPNHYIMDSLRKVSPLPGSFLYQHKQSSDISPDALHHEWRYFLSAHWKFFLFRIVFVLGTLIHNTSLVRYAHKISLRAHDDVIGDSNGGYAGIPWVPHIHTHFNFEKIQKRKYTQTLLYEKYLSQMLPDHPEWYQIEIPETEKKYLHVFPIGFRGSTTAFSSTETYLHSRGIIVWFKFPDSLWSRHRGILFLPLGFHITNNNIKYSMDTLTSIPQKILKQST